MKISRRARSSFPRISDIPYPSIGLSMYQRIKEGMGKGLSARNLRELVVKGSALAGAESTTAISTQGRGDVRAIPQRHGAGLVKQPGPFTLTAEGKA